METQKEEEQSFINTCTDLKELSKSENQKFADNYESEEQLAALKQRLMGLKVDNKDGEETKSTSDTPADVE